ncbi:MAG TPA: hypothetical protein ENH82_12125 [bacterium]|nr:hypothetical protein [bacterium]
MFSEPYLTGLIFKTYEHIQKGTLPDGSYGEGFGYYGFSMQTWAELLPSLENALNIDLSASLNGSYQEPIWSGIIKDKYTFYFGDSGSNLAPIPNFAWLLPRYRDPLLGWLYNFLKKDETLMDVLYDTENVPQDDPFDENPVRLFRDVGTTVFKSGWEKDDFVFVMRTGPFFNHQHFDQGTFWFADYGSIFIEERHGSTYDNTPYYRPWYTKPVAHSTILIDDNHQSQRGGDPLNFAEGFHEHAFVDHFLDGEFAAFSSGDIGKLYRGKVKDLKRNVLYIKPRTVLMLDTIVPSEHYADVDVSLLYQTTYLKDITPGKQKSTITKDGNTLNILHLYPEHMEVKSVQTPHYFYTLRNTKPLVKEGMLTVTTRTNRTPLVIGNLLTATRGCAPEVTIEYGEGFVFGTARDVPFAFTTKLNAVYKINGISTDALAITWKENTIFAAQCKKLNRNGALLLESQEPVTCEISPGTIKYYVSKESEVLLGVKPRPVKLIVNGKPVKDYKYEPERRAVKVKLPAGEGTVEFDY